MKNSSLQSTWLQRIEQLHRSIHQSSSLECLTRCSARCCPKAKNSTSADKPVGHVAIMLPFEMEYILAKTDMNPEQLLQAEIEFTTDTKINIGFMTSEKPCPFLTAHNQCGIHEFRPLDCRSFPLIPVFNLEENNSKEADSGGLLSFRIDNECPSSETLSPAYERELKTVWEKLLPHLPMTYQLLYNEL